MGMLFMKLGQDSCPRKCLGTAVFLVGLAVTSWASPVSAQVGARKPKEPAPDPMAEIEKVKAEFEQRLADGEAAAKAREEAIRKEQAAAVEAARDEADKRVTADRNERQADILRLQKALEEARPYRDQARAYPKRQEEALKRWNRACSVF